MADIKDTLKDIIFIADIHISPITIADLQSIGFKIKRVTEFLSEKSADNEIINLAIEKDAVIITQDLDFSNIIVHSGLNKPSIISIRIEKPQPSAVTKILIKLLPNIKDQLIKGCIVSVDESQFRIRELPVKSD